DSILHISPWIVSRLGNASRSSLFPNVSRERQVQAYFYKRRMLFYHSFRQSKRIMKQRTSAESSLHQESFMNPLHPSRSIATTGSELLLGWESRAAQSFGFGVRPISAHVRQAITYDEPAHLITVAPTRSGKGRGVIVPNLLHYRGQAVILDPKGENYQVTA